MHPEDIDALVSRVQAADAEGLSILIAGTRNQLQTFVARYAASPAMVETAVNDTWVAAFRDIAGCAPGGFRDWIIAHARAQLERLLREGEQRAAAGKDALAHVMLRPAGDALAAAPADPDGEAAALRAGIDALEAKSRQIVAKRYGERAAIETIAKLVGETPAKTTALLFRARAALAGMADLGIQIANSDPLLVGLVEDFLNGLIVPDSRELLAGSVLKDLRYSALFEAQVRSDLLLRAVLATANLETARAQAYAMVTPKAESDRRKALRPSDSHLRAAGATNEGRVRAIGGASERLPAAGHAKPSGGGPWLWIGLGLVVIAIAIAVFATAKNRPPAPRTLPLGDPVATAPLTTPGVATPPAAVAVGPEMARVESGQGMAHSAAGRFNLQPGSALHAGDGLDTEGAKDVLVLVFPDQRKLTVQANSALSELRVDAKTLAVTLDHGQVAIACGPGGRAVAIAVAGGAVETDDGAISVRAVAGSVAVEVGRGTARIKRGAGAAVTVAERQVAAIDPRGELSVETGGTFVAGINLGGPSLFIDGHRWKSQRHAQADGLTVAAGEAATVGAPAGADPALLPLLTSALAGSGAVQFSQALPNGSYDVEAWVVGDAGGSAGTLTIGGREMPAASFGKEHWRRLGPYRCTVANHQLDVRFHGDEQQKLAGVAFFACGAVEGGVPPTAFLIEPADDLSVEAPGTLQLKAEVYAPESPPGVVEFYADALKIGEAKAPPYACTWNYQTAGTVHLSARAIGAGGAKGSSQAVTVVVKAKEVEKPKPALSLAVVDAKATYAPPATITLTAAPLRTDAATLKVEFFAAGAKLGEATAAPFQFQWPRIAAGEYPVTATATLAGGEQIKAEAMVVVVAAPANLPPTVAIESPLDGDEVPASGRLTIKAKAGDSDGRVVKVEFLADEQKIGETTAPPYSFTWTKAAAGPHQLTAVAVDDRGAKTASEPVLVIAGKTSGFVLLRGIDLGGPAADVEGGHWLAHDEALADGLSLSAGKVVADQVTLAPAAEGGAAIMLGSAFQADQEELAITQEIPDGIFQVCLWLCEPKTANAHVCELEVQGAKQIPAIGRLAKGAWAKYGPYIAKVRNQQLSIVLRGKASSPPRLAGLAIYAPPSFSPPRIQTTGNVPRPLVEVLFDAVAANTTPPTTPNSGLTASAAPTGTFTSPGPQPSANVPPGGGSGSVDFGKDSKAIAVDLPGALPALKGLKSFTLSGWLNSRSNQMGPGGNRIMCWLDNGDGVDLASYTDGSIRLGVNSWNDVGPIGPSSAGRIPANELAPADNWRFFAVTYDSTAASQQVRYYFGSAAEKAVLDRATDAQRGAVGNNPISEMAIGGVGIVNRRANSNSMFRGLIDQVRVWGSVNDGSGALTPEQIVAVQGMATRITLRPAVTKADAVVPQGLVVWLNAASGVAATGDAVARWLDLSGNGHHASQDNAANRPHLVAKEVNGRPALSFKGEEALELANTRDLEPEALTLMAWVRQEEFPTDGEGRRWLIGKNGNELISGHFSLLTNRDRAAAYLNIGGGFERSGEMQGAGALTSRAWHQLASTYEGGKLQLYVDGAKVAERALEAKRVQGAGPMIIGRRADLWGQFAGQLDEVRVYDRALNDGEIRLIERQLREKFFTAPSAEAGAGPGAAANR